jgi:hypothetical protein
MKINFVKTIIAMSISLLIAYALFSFNDIENRILLSVGGFLFLAVTLVVTIGTSFERPRTSTNIKAASGVFFVIGFIENLMFTFISFSIPTYIITSGLLLLIFILITYSLYRANE